MGSFCDYKDHEDLWALELFCGWNIEEFGILREKNSSMLEADLNSGRNYWKNAGINVDSGGPGHNVLETNKESIRK